MNIEPEEYEINSVTYVIAGLPSSTSDRPARICFYNRDEAEVTFDLMKRYAGEPVFNISKDTPGEAALFNALGHFGVVPKQIILLKVYTVVEALDIS